MPFSRGDQPLYEIKADLFKAIGHPVRIRLLELLSTAPELSVTQLLSEIDAGSSNLSQHLAVLRRQDLVRTRREGSQIHYRLAHPEVADLLTSARTLLATVLRSRAQDSDGFEGLPAVGRA